MMHICINYIPPYVCLRQCDIALMNYLFFCLCSGDDVKVDESLFEDLEDLDLEDDDLEVC